MLCPNCHGQHFISSQNEWVPCPECNGAGEIHCCDGLQMQSEQCGNSEAQEAACRMSSVPAG